MYNLIYHLSLLCRKDILILTWKRRCWDSRETFLLFWFSHSVVPTSLWPHGLQQARLPYSSSPEACSNSCPLNWWCHPTISSSAVPFFSFLQSSPASGSFLTNRQLIPDNLFISSWSKLLCYFWLQSPQQPSMFARDQGVPRAWLLILKQGQSWADGNKLGTLMPEF